MNILQKATPPKKKPPKNKNEKLIYPARRSIFPDFSAQKLEVRIIHENYD